MLLERSSSQDILLPEIGLQVSVRVTKSIEKCLDEVTHGTGMSTSRGVAIPNASHGQERLSSRRRHKSSTTRGRDETNADRTTLSSHLGRHSVRSGSLTSPVSTTDGSDIELGSEDSSTNSGGDFGGALDSKSDMSSGISYGDECLEN